jgi:hypothetical protein
MTKQDLRDRLTQAKDACRVANDLASVNGDARLYQIKVETCYAWEILDHVLEFLDEVK